MVVVRGGGDENTSAGMKSRVADSEVELLSIRSISGDISGANQLILEGKRVRLLMDVVVKSVNPYELTSLGIRSPE